MARIAVAALVLGLASALSPLLAQGAPTSAELQLAKQADVLKPGEWVWAPQVARSGPVLVYVDLGRHTVFATSGSVLPGGIGPAVPFSVSVKEDRIAFNTIRAGLAFHFQ